MGKTKTAANAAHSTPHAGIKHNTCSSRSHESSTRGFDWFWLVLALLAVLMIFLPTSTA